ncbi:MAG: hypothetical protein JFR24_04810 [Muribaculaceae bacterium]|nr:hypothetical protein [Muribaculaceae bacterium]
MKKLLLSLLLLVGIGMTAGALVHEFDFSKATNWPQGDKNMPTKETDYTLGSHNHTLSTCNSYIINGNALFLTKSSGYVILPEFDKPVDRIEIKAGPACAKAATVTVTGADNTNVTTAKLKTVGTAVIDVNSDQAGVRYKVAANSSGNAQISKITVYLKAIGVSISASTGSTNYAQGNNRIFAGTEVTFTVTNCDDANIVGTVNDEEMTFTDGVCTLTINENAKVEIVAGTGDDVQHSNYDFTAILGQFRLVTDATELKAGDRLIIANTENNAAMANIVKANNKDKVSVSITDGVLTYTVRPLILSLGGEDGKWTFKTQNYGGITTSEDEGYLAATGTGTKNYMDVQEDPAPATINIGTNGDATIKFASSNRNILRYNATNSIFSCYSGGQEPVQIYKYYTGENEAEVVGITYEVFAGKTVVRVNYVLHVNNHQDGNLYEVTLTIGDQKASVRHAVPDGDSDVATNTALYADSFTATHTFTGSAVVTGLSGETDYKANFVTRINNEQVVSHSIDIPNIKTGTVGIEDVAVDNDDNAPAEYFNLQGVHVAHPEAGNIYIVRRGAKVSKELVK